VKQIRTKLFITQFGAVGNIPAAPFLKIRPCFITKETRLKDEMFSGGLPSTAIKSAARPGWILLVRRSIRHIFAAFTVAPLTAYSASL